MFLLTTHKTNVYIFSFIVSALDEQVVHLIMKL